MSSQTPVQAACYGKYPIYNSPFHLYVLFLLENKNSNLYFRTKKAPELFLKAGCQWAFDANEYIQYISSYLTRIIEADFNSVNEIGIFAYPFAVLLKGCILNYAYYQCLKT